MNRSTKALAEVHEIMAKIYDSQRGMSKDELIRDFNKEGEKFAREHGLKIHKKDFKKEKELAA